MMDGMDVLIAHCIPVFSTLMLSIFVHHDGAIISAISGRTTLVSRALVSIAAKHELVDARNASAVAT